MVRVRVKKRLKPMTEEEWADYIDPDSHWCCYCGGKYKPGSGINVGLIKFLGISEGIVCDSECEELYYKIQG